MASSIDPPDNYLCPISQEIMTDPVLASDGHHYERRCIVGWINLKGMHATSPKTNELLQSHSVYPDHSLRIEINEKFMEKQRVAANTETQKPMHMKKNKSTTNVAAVTSTAELSDVPDQPQEEVVPEQPPLSSTSVDHVAHEAAISAATKTTTTITTSTATTTTITAAVVSTLSTSTIVVAGEGAGAKSTAVEEAVMHPATPPALSVAVAPPAVMEQLPALIPVTASRGAHATVTPKAVRTSSVAQNDASAAVVVPSAERLPVAQHAVQPTGERVSVVAGIDVRQRKGKQRKASKRVNDKEEESRLLEEAQQAVQVSAQRSHSVTMTSVAKMLFVVVGLVILFSAWRVMEGTPESRKLMVGPESIVDVKQFLGRQQGNDKDKSSHKDASQRHDAAENDHFEVVRLLLKQGMDIDIVDNNGVTPLYFASLKGYLKVVRFLVRKGAEMDKTKNNGCSSLYAAAGKGYLPIVQYLVEHGADKDKADENDITPLHAAVQNGHLEVLRFLVEQGADKDKFDDYGYSPLFTAAHNGHLAMVHILVEHGANKDKADENGISPLCAAAANGHLDVVRYLVEQGADKDKADNNDWTPLYFATSMGHAKVVSYLISSGASLTERNSYGTLPIDVAANEMIKQLIHAEEKRRRDN